MVEADDITFLFPYVALLFHLLNQTSDKMWGVFSFAKHFVLMSSFDSDNRVLNFMYIHCEKDNAFNHTFSTN